MKKDDIKYQSKEENLINVEYERESSYGENENIKIEGMNKRLFLELAFCRAYEIEFNADEYNRMDNLEYADDNYYCLQDVIADEKMMKKIEEYADKIRNFISKLD
jgi:hypothetical protein